MPWLSLCNAWAIICKDDHEMDDHYYFRVGHHKDHLHVRDWQGNAKVAQYARILTLCKGHHNVMDGHHYLSLIDSILTLTMHSAPLPFDEICVTEIPHT